jgi:hypothetical protein
MLSDWVSLLAYPNLFRIKGFVVGGDGVVTRSNSQETKNKANYI